MPVDSKADRYLATAPKWRLMRDCMAGEDVVKAEAIINWHERRENGTTALDMLVLDEGETRRDPADPFETRRSERWRVIWQADGVAVETWTRPSPDAPPVPAGPPLPLSGGGRALTEAPFVFVGARDLTADPDEVPLLGLAQTALSLYRRSADYEQSLFMTSQATPVVVGVAGDDPNAPRAIGASTIWHLPQGADAKFLEVSGSGLAAQRQAQEDDFARAMQAGAQLLDHAAAESGEALRLRHAAQSATLISIARTVAAGIEQALRHAARWIGADPEAVSYRPNLDFVDSAASADVIRAIVDAWSAGAISSRTRHELFQRYELVPVERGHDEESALIGRPDPDAAPAARR
ncbi:DUF4055 domain-containing protein [Oceanibacterium hippocampi]|uniref:DUF4055 domain-containing protein n=1 Tax=Oceanibacterium hippocampi TaxID=745714 RepID=A0A1Y5S538_9PROT|nr:DUF4055 domain-containing protein [Oceanibacterium hippocampi]SLN31916.1 hypothetical protein OCH7691_01160 [Oceanibacterium hippocampi]